MNEQLAQKLRDLPRQPGVYFHKDKGGEIIYVGKAAVLKNRVRQYFQASRTRDAKTEALVAEIADTDWMEVASELEALFLEAEMVRRYMPRYNILLRDDKALSYIRIDYDSEYPTVTTTRQPLDDGARYFGPYFGLSSIRQALKLLRKVFPFAITKSHEKRANLHYHLGLDPGLESGQTSLADYRKNLRRLMAVIEGKGTKIEAELGRDMKLAAKGQDFELAARIRNQLHNLQNLKRQVIFSDKEFLDISKDHALNELVELLSLPNAPQRIEGYDISHMQGRDVVASMVVFTNGVSNKAEYRKFKTKIDHNNDFYNMNETIRRRLTTVQSSSEKTATRTKNAWKQRLPNIVLIDGGKGQLDAAIRARDEVAETQGQAVSDIPFIGLAKREEQIVIAKGRSHVILSETVLHTLGGYLHESDDFILVNVPHNTNLVKLLQRIRDESHRFAVSYHSTLKQQRQTRSLLDDIPGVGPITRKKLIRSFGSARAVQTASLADLEAIVGKKLAVTIAKWTKRGVIG